MTTLCLIAHKKLLTHVREAEDRVGLSCRSLGPIHCTSPSLCKKLININGIVSPLLVRPTDNSFPSRCCGESGDFLCEGDACRPLVPRLAASLRSSHIRNVMARRWHAMRCPSRDPV